MSKKILRIVSLVLVIATLFSVFMTASAAFGPKNRWGTSTVRVLTYGDKLFGKTSKVTIKNTSDDPIIVTVPTSISNCSASRGAGFGFGKTCTIYAGGKASFAIRTGLFKVGTVEFTIRNAFGGKHSADITGTNTSAMAVVG